MRIGHHFQAELQGIEGFVGGVAWREGAVIRWEPRKEIDMNAKIRFCRRSCPCVSGRTATAGMGDCHPAPSDTF